jgi:predicted restriction endonuclease
MASEGGGFNGYGAVPGIAVGRIYPSREALSKAKVHRPLMAGICGTKARGGAESIVVSGGYPDDQDYGEVIIYTGHGGRDPATGRQVKDQDLTDSGNAALVASRISGRPVRVIRGANGVFEHSPAEGYRYDGLFVVDDHWSSIGLDRFLIWQFRLRQLGQESESDEVLRGATDIPMPAGNPAPNRNERIARTLARSREVAERVKRVHNYACQICGIVLEIPGGLRYAETAHIRGLGHPHNGPDQPDNALCLCPSHHALFDLGGITIDESLQVINETSGSSIGHLRLHRRHHVNREYLRYHRELYRQRISGADALLTDSESRSRR